MTRAIILGAYGSAGVAAAEALVDEPAIDQVTLIDDGDPGGGLCILRGCMPSKAVLSVAEHRYQARHNDRLHSDTTVDLERTVERTRDQVDNFAAHRRAAVDRMTERDDVEFITIPPGSSTITPSPSGAR